MLTTGFKYIFNFDVVTSVKKFFTNEPEIDLTVNNYSDGEIGGEPQVYNIPDNRYTYKNAEALCKAYNGRLANYKDMMDAYENGANWCSYGWSANQSALFPTQYETWEKLQKIKGHENDCGRPGINGGYIANENSRFGVNCFGYKPKINALEQRLMDDLPKYPTSDDEKNLNARVAYWKTKIKDILIAPFNNDNWSIV